MKGGMGSHQSGRMEKDEWLTPPHILDALGDFDLDPCAPVCRPWSTARNHYTIEDNGMLSPWAGGCGATRLTAWRRQGGLIVALITATPSRLFLPEQRRECFLTMSGGGQVPCCSSLAVFIFIMLTAPEPKLTRALRQYWLLTAKTTRKFLSVAVYPVIL